MYTYIVSFKVKDGEGITFVELQKFEELTEAKPAGLDHFHIFKDRNEENRYFLVEYWTSIEDRIKMEKSKEHYLFKEHRKLIIDKKYETYECDVIV
ncbi:antibiotic biosynthesis monooxygenase [Lutibacter sp. A64]|uniref:putative quinol monooxygenase n=1 Tax=Lutibacter sp. A64 TaxID=2918526 RepID=UPI001F055BE1|nr:antibiotic biosynthesis monooxygenase [Lutibacter sp. A64]UMB53437.1 antibiotic biosynthesis monooxygenase [Lutibacter sp. A64]